MIYLVKSAVLCCFFLVLTGNQLHAQTHISKTDAISRVQLNNGGFELPNLPAGTYQYGPTTPYWSLNRGCAIATNGSGFTNSNPDTPEGDQVLVLQNSGIAISSVNITTPGAYRFTIKAAQRKGNNQTFAAYLDNEEIAEITPEDDSYKYYFTVVMQMNAGEHQFELKGLNPLGGDNSALIDDITIEHLRSWNDPNSWEAGSVPNSNSTVSISSGSAIVLEGSCNAKTIMVDGFLWGANNANIQLAAEGIFVSRELEIGKEKTPFIGNCDITLVGNNPELDLMMGMGSKVLAAMDGGVLSLHGKSKLSWTQLNQTASAGSNQIVLAKAVNWEVGDAVVIASTDYDMNQAEEAVITHIGSDLKTIMLDRNLQYKHFGERQTYTSGNGNSWILDERAEVGLLSHNITIKGDDSSVDSKFGGHVMIHHNGSKGYISNVEFKHMGQRKLLGRYPFHWHKVTDAQGQYIRSSSIHHTFNRAVTIHETNNTKVQQNVAYDNLGHAFFMESGVETNNVIQDNLGLVTRKPDAQYALLPSDIFKERNASGPATFWITHPQNIVNNNHAAGSDGSGFWFAPIGEAMSIPLLDGGMDDNLAHSNRHGWVIGAGVPDVSTGVPVQTSPYAPQNSIPIFRDITVYKNLLGTYSRVGFADISSEYHNLIVADNYKGDATTWLTDYYKVLWVGASANYSPQPEGDDMAVGGATGLVHLHTIYDGPVHVYDSHFAGVSKSNMSLFDQWGANIKYTGQTFERTTIENGSYQVRYRDHYYRPVWLNAVVYDVDGAMTGRPMTAISQDHPVLIDNESMRIKEGYSGMASPHRYGYVEVMPSDEIPPEEFQGGIKRQISTFLRSDGALLRDEVREIEGISIVPILNGKYTYELIYEEVIPKSTELRYYSMNAGEYVIIGFPNMPASSVVFTKKLFPVTKKANLAALKIYNGTAWAYENETVYVRYQAPGGASFRTNEIIGTLLLYSGLDDDVARVDSDGDGYNDYQEQLLGRNPTDLSDLGFNFYHDNESWLSRINLFTDNNLHEDGWWKLTKKSNDPGIYRSGFNFNASQVDNLQINVSADAIGYFQLFWAGSESEGFSQLKSEKIYYSESSQNKILTFDLLNNPNWNGNIAKLRLDFPDNSSTTSIKWIRHKSPSHYLYGINSNGTTNTEVTLLDGNSFYKYKTVESTFSTIHSKNVISQYDGIKYDMDDKTDLAVVKPVNTGSGKVEVHIMDGASNFKQWLLHSSTALVQGYENDHFKFADLNLDGKDDLWLINHISTGSGNTELHVLNGSGQYQTFLMQRVTGLALQSNPNIDFILGDHDKDEVPDVWFIKPNTVTNSAEIHILSSKSGFAEFTIQLPTKLPANNGDWSYAASDYNLDGQLDLLAINKNGSSGKVEITILDGITSFSKEILFQITELPAVAPNWEFVADDFLDSWNGLSSARMLTSETLLDNNTSGDRSTTDLPLLYPNPASSEVYLNFTNSANEKVIVSFTNSLGEKVLEEEVEKTNRPLVINTTQIKPGLYFVSMTTGDGKAYLSKVIIK